MNERKSLFIKLSDTILTQLIVCGQYIMRQMHLQNQGGKNQGYKVKNRLVTILLIISLFLFIGSVFQTSKKIQTVNKGVKDREKQLTKLRDEEKKLQEKYDEITSPEYMEKQLRNQLNLSKENEIVLVLPPDDVLKELVPPDDAEEEFDVKPNYQKWAEVFGVKF